MFQRFLIAFAQVKADNSYSYENLLNEIGQITCVLHQVKEIIKKVYNNVINSIKS